MAVVNKKNNDKNILKWLDENLEEKVMGIALWGIVIVMFMQVIMRYVFKASLSWSEELSRYLFVWMVFIGMGYGVKKSSHMRIDMLEHFVPRLKKPLEILANLSLLVFAGLMIQPGISVLKAIKASGQTSPAAGVPMYFVYVGLFIGFLLVVIRVIQNFVLMFTKKGAK